MYLTSSEARGSRATFDIQLADNHFHESYTELFGTERHIAKWHDRETEARQRPKEANGAIVYDYPQMFSKRGPSRTKHKSRRRMGEDSAVGSLALHRVLLVRDLEETLASQH